MAPVLRGYKRLTTHVFQFLDKIYCAHNDDQFIVSLCSTQDKTCMLATLVACVNSSGCVLPVLTDVYPVPRLANTVHSCIKCKVFSCACR